MKYHNECYECGYEWTSIGYDEPCPECEECENIGTDFIE